MTDALFNITPLLLLTALLTAQGPQLTVVPAAYASTDANSYLGMTGATHAARHQTLIGSSHLAGMVGHDITAVEFRRTAADETFQGSSIDFLVKLSTSSNDPLTCSRTFSANVGNDEDLVFQGSAVLPTSPPQLGPSVAWTQANVLRIVFQRPFRYQGGTLCLDITGTTSAISQASDWWPADAVFEDIGGDVTEMGGGCGSYGFPQGSWSHLTARTLLPGGYARFWAYGMPNTLAIAAFGSASSQPVPLTALGINQPGCNVHLQPNSIAGSVIAFFEPSTRPELVSRGGVAQIYLRLPNQQWMLGARLTTQWFDLGQLATSNALQWTVAGAMPSLDMALVGGSPQESTGHVTVHLAHVLRFEHQAP